MDDALLGIFSILSTYCFPQRGCNQRVPGLFGNCSFCNPNACCQTQFWWTQWLREGLDFCVPDYKLPRFKRRISSLGWKEEILTLWFDFVAACIFRKFPAGMGISAGPKECSGTVLTSCTTVKYWFLLLGLFSWAMLKYCNKCWGYFKAFERRKHCKSHEQGLLLQD